MPHRSMGETSEHFVNSTLTRLTPEALVINVDNGRLSLRNRIKNLYGEDIHKKTRMLEILNVKISRNLARLAFLKRCRDKKVLPNCVRLKHHKKSRPIDNILRRAEFSILRNEINDTRFLLFTLNKELTQLKEDLKNIIDEPIWEEVLSVVERKADRVLKLTTDKQKDKYNRIQEQNNQFTTPSTQLDPNKVIVNLTEEVIDEPTTSLLMKGLNYAVAPNRIPTEEIVCAIENAVKDLLPEKAEEIRQDVSVVLRKAKPPKSNLSREEILALKDLKKDDSRIILPADKGNATVIMKTEQYKEKMKKMISEGPYKVIRNPTRRIATSVSRVVKSALNIEKHLKNQLIVSDPRPPLLYGLPKIHKANIPMRPIVSSIGSPTYNIAKFISRHLNEHVGKTETFVKDSRHFINIIKGVQVDKDDLLVSFDVESLFTKVPITETIELINELLSPELTELADLCLRSAYFYFDGKYYEQTDGAAMGSPLSPVAANLYMEHFEKTAIESCELKPKIWVRYVDDVWAVWPHGTSTLNNFLDHLNSIHPNIKFTMELEKDRKLAFLDVLTERKGDGSLGHAVYRKPTHTNRYLNATSHHHPAQKYGILNTLINRAIHISDPYNWKSEKSTLQLALTQNGYKKTDISRAFKKQSTRQVFQDQEQNTNDVSVVANQGPENRPKMAFLPYVKGTTDKIGRILKKNEIKPIFKPTNKIRDLLRPIKDKIPLSASGVYEIPCSCGSVYIGETKRQISTRLKEHIRHTKKEDIDKSAVAEHSKVTRHGILFDKTKVLANVPFYYPRKVREAIEIYKRGSNFNKDDSLRLPRTWGPVLQKLKIN